MFLYARLLGSSLPYSHPLFFDIIAQNRAEEKYQSNVFPQNHAKLRVICRNSQGTLRNFIDFPMRVW
jgi:hypothetical protein